MLNDFINFGMIVSNRNRLHVLNVLRKLMRREKVRKYRHKTWNQKERVTSALTHAFNGVNLKVIF